MGIFVSVEKIAECVVIALFFACAMTLAGFKLLAVLQSSGYSGVKLLKWSFRKSNLAYTKLALLTLAQALSCAVLAVCFSFTGEWAAIISLAAYLIFYPVYAYADNKIALRCPAALTPRFKRLIAALWFTCLVICYFGATFLNYGAHVWGNMAFSTFKYVLLAITPVALIPIICLANGVTKIYETPKNAAFVKKAAAKLKASEVKVIGITGSYGKTSVKNILTAMLSQKYKVLATPASYNTPMGIALTISSNDLSEYDFFIAEMGARHAGDIAELCKVCPPDYSIITGICPQHLETFKSVENIISAKGEILNATKVKSFIAADCCDLFTEFPSEKINCGRATEVVSSPAGTEFTLTLGGESRRVKCKLLGVHSAQNIALCACAAYSMGVTFDQIEKAIENLDFVEHRLQLIENNGVYIIDDGYNSNVKGAKAAVEVLKTFGGRKIVVTPGLVELGVLDEKENAALGAEFVGLDKIILVGATLVGFVKQGYLDAGGDGDKITIVASLEKAQDELKGYLSSGDAVLFLNDLPDSYH